MKNNEKVEMIDIKKFDELMKKLTNDFDELIAEVNHTMEQMQ